jgi:hypothetical protein
LPYRSISGKLKLLKELKVPEAGFFMDATACCPHKTGQSDAPKRC